MNILVLDAGSSTLKFRLYRREAASEECLADGLVDRVGTPGATLHLTVAGREVVNKAVIAETPGQAAEEAIGCLLSQFAPSSATTPERLNTQYPTPNTQHPHFQDTDVTVNCVGHRIVHGGARFVAPTRLTPEVIAEIRALSELAPLHNPAGLAGIEAGLRLLPDVPAVAVFDTAFHRTLPKVASRYALPWELCERHGLRRYGFHGISHQVVSRRLLECLGRGVVGTRVITCHLGNGASVCAIRDGRSVDTSMGLTPLEGLVMGTRSGDVDPGLLLHLLRTCNLTASELEDLLLHQSGLRGLSGLSGDMRDLERAAQEGDARAELALEIFAYRVRKYIGAYAAALEGLDAVAFTGGIGEHSASMRGRICRGLEFLGLHLDSERNRMSGNPEPTRIHTDGSPVQAWAIPTDEEGEIARETYALLTE